MYAMSCACETVVLYMYLCVGGGGWKKRLLLNRKLLGVGYFLGVNSPCFGRDVQLEQLREHLFP